VPSVAGLVGGVCLAIVSLTMIAVAVLFFTFGSRVATEEAAFSRALATTASALATIPATGTLWLLARYRKRRVEFAAAWQRFHNDRDQGVRV
jgi:uncharacterized membrane protein YqjE